MTCILLLIWHVSSSSYDMYPPPHMTCILLLIWHVSSSSYDMSPPPHMTCILLLIWHVSSSSSDMYPPPHMTCILLLIWHVSSSSYDMYPPPHMTCLRNSIIMVVSRSCGASQGNSRGGRGNKGRLQRKVVKGRKMNFSCSPQWATEHAWGSFQSQVVKDGCNGRCGVRWS
jgi:hypothetical protein